MPPKKAAGTRGKSQSHYQSTRNNIPLRYNFDDSGSEGTINSSGLKAASSQTRSLLGSHNTLKQLLAGPSTKKKVCPQTPAKPNGRLKKRNVTLSPINSASTPISHLKHATGRLDTKGKLPIMFEDIEKERPPQKKQRSSEPSKSLETTNSTILSEKRLRQRKIKPQSNGRSRKTPKIEKFPEDDESYVEQVSHHEVDLTDDTISGSNHLRRSSYGSRGKRGSSIGNGFVAKPHPDVEVQDYYKLLDPSMIDSHRMRQLLTWCYRKSEEIDESDNYDTSVDAKTVEGIMKVIERNYLDDLTTGKISTSWYDVKDISAKNKVNHFRIPGTLRPNPLNEANKESIEVYKHKLETLRAEKAQLLSAYNSTINGLSGLNENDAVSENELPKYLQRNEPKRKFSEKVLESSLYEQMQTDVKLAKNMVENDLDFNVQKLRVLSHRLRQRTVLARKLSQNILEPEFTNLVCTFKERRDITDNQKSPSTLELLRGIARLDHQKKTLNRRSSQIPLTAGGILSTKVSDSGTQDSNVQ